MLGGATISECSALEEELPKYRLLKLFDAMGIYRVGFRRRLSKKRSRENPFQEVAVAVLAGKGAIVSRSGSRGSVFYVEEWRGKGFLAAYASSNGCASLDTVFEHYSNSSASSSRLLGNELYREPKPLVVLDFSALSWHRHGSEYSSLRRQVSLALGAVREYLWDHHLALTSLSPGVREWLRSFLASGWVKYSLLHPEEYLSSMGIEPSRVIALDPGAEKPLKPVDVLRGEAFIVGAIVDKMPWRNLTSKMLDLSAPRAERRRLVLRDSSVGVPHRVNIVVEILLKARYSYCGDVEKAITSSMTRRDRVIRLHREILKASQGGRKPVSWSLYREIREWLPATRKEFIAAARKAGVRIENREV